MSDLILEDLINYIEESKEPEYIQWDCKMGTKVNVRTTLSIAERQEFVSQVIENTYADIVEPSYINADIAFIITFLQMCTDIPLPTKTVDKKTIIDSQTTYEIAVTLGLADTESGILSSLSYVSQLKNCIDKQIEFRNAKIIAYTGMSTASDEAIETVALLANKAVELLDLAIDKLDKGGNKFIKNLTPKKVNDALNSIIKGVINDSKSDNNDNIIGIKDRKP